MSRYLGIEINDYMAVNLEGIGVFNDAIGGMAVTLTEYFSAYDTLTVKGTMVTLFGNQASITL